MTPDVFDGEWDFEPLTVDVVGKEARNLRGKVPERFRRHLDLGFLEDVEVDRATEVYGVVLGPDVTLPGGGLKTLPVDEPGPGVPAVRLSELAGEPGRRTFVGRIYGYARWREFLETDPGFPELREFHSREKMTLLASDPVLKEELGQLLTDGRQVDLPDLLDEYGTSFLEALAGPTTRRRHQNVLEHLFGYLSEMLPEDRRRELLDLIHSFGRGEVPLLEPLVALKGEFEDRSIEWVGGQSYLNPTALQVRLKGISDPSGSE